MITCIIAKIKFIVSIIIMIIAVFSKIFALVRAVHELISLEADEDSLTIRLGIRLDWHEYIDTADEIIGSGSLRCAKVTEDLILVEIPLDRDWHPFIDKVAGYFAELN